MVTRKSPEALKDVEGCHSLITGSTCQVLQVSKEDRLVGDLGKVIEMSRTVSYSCPVSPEG